jgi:beta-galactosidase
VDDQVARITVNAGLVPLALILCSAVPLGMAHAQNVAASPAQTDGRSIQDIGAGWRFHFGDTAPGATADAPAQAGFDDSQWEQVSVPHSWNRIGSYGLQRAPDSNNQQGLGWYRLTFNAPAAKPGQRQYLDFGAVSKIADVWVNGVHVGQHKGAFARFRFDVTAQWKPGARNLIVVRADNSKVEIGSSTADTIPLAGDFFVHGGMYRGASLVTVEDAGFDLLDHGGPGLYARSITVSPEKAEVAVLARLRNSGPRRRSLQLVTTIADAQGHEVARAVQPVKLAAGASEAKANLTLASPHLWNGTADPYLYTISAELTESGRPVDRVTQPLGIRSFRVDADTGFFLNGRALKLHGVSRHQDRMGKGWALSEQDHAEDMALIREMGANTVRQAHYQHADSWSDEADRAGMAVWAELPYVTAPSLSGGQGSPELWANAEEQLRELIRQNYNHPSIMMWSIGNEVDSAKGFGIGKDPARPLALLQHLDALAKAEDPSRPTTFADCCEDLGMVKTAGEALAGTADLIGYNRYYGWYYADPLKARAQLGAQMDKFHAKHPGLPISISEYGGGGAITQHSDDITAGFLSFVGRPQPEEFESFVHEANWPAIRDRPFIFASWAWNMFDFPSDLRGEGDSVDLNTKGLVTFDRKVKKDAFYYYKAQWNPEPMVWLTSKRYADRAYPVIEVKAYSNAAKASLTLNGKPLGEVACADRICLWPGVALRPGANQAVVTASVDGHQVRDEASWTGPDPTKGIRVEAGDLAGHVVDGRQFGSDSFVTGGRPTVLNMGGFGGRRLMAERTVVADHPEYYDFWREGEAFSYLLPVPDGRWTVTIHSFEPRKAGADAVTMSVSANGQVALPAFSVLKEAGGPLHGIARRFPVTVKGGQLKLDFTGSGGKAVVAAIEVSPR